MEILFKPIGFVRTKEENVPRHWSLSVVEGELVIKKAYQRGLSNICEGQKIVVLFYFHKSPDFEPDRLQQTPPHRDNPQGVFSICSPIRPNRIGLSVLEVTRVEDNIIRVKGIDMLDETPILDIKPYVKEEDDCPSYHVQDQTGSSR